MSYLRKLYESIDQDAHKEVGKIMKLIMN